MIFSVTITVAILIRTYKLAFRTLVFSDNLSAVLASDQLILAAVRALEPYRSLFVRDPFLAA